MFMTSGFSFTPRQLKTEFQSPPIITGKSPNLLMLAFNLAKKSTSLVLGPYIDPIITVWLKSLAFSSR
jgi:hypothetical protein